MKARPVCIRVSELADIIGVSKYTLRKRCQEVDLPLIQVRRQLDGPPAKGGGPLYLPVETAIEVATALLGKMCDRTLRRRLRRSAQRQDEAFGGARVEVELACSGAGKVSPSNNGQ